MVNANIIPINFAQKSHQYNYLVQMSLNLTQCTLTFSNNVQYQSTATLEVQLTLVTHRGIDICEQRQKYSHLTLHNLVLTKLLHCQS